MYKRILITLKDITESGGGERVGANLANAFARDLGYEVRVVSFFKSGTTPFYMLDSRVSCVYLCTSPAKGKNALTTLFNKTIFRAWLCLKVHRFATQSDIILANDGWFVPLFRYSNSSLQNSTNRALFSSLRGEAEAIQTYCHTEGIARSISNKNDRDSSPTAQNDKSMDCFGDKLPHNDKKARLFIRLWHINAPKRARKKLRLFDALVILSEREMGRWQRYHSNVKVIPNFLPTIPQVATNHSQKVVLSVGRMSSEKGFLRLLDIWKAVQVSITCHTEGIARSISNKNDRDSLPSLKNDKFGDSLLEAQNDRNGDSSLRASAPLRMTKGLDFASLNEWKLIIVGDGVLKGEIESKIRALNLGESVLLKPFTKDIEREYLGASIYAMASHFEGFPMVLLESTAYGLAPISFDIATGPSEIIEHNKSGFLIADNDLESYTNHLIKLMRDESMRIAFGKEAKRIVEKRFSKEVIMEKWREVFEC